MALFRRNKTDDTVALPEEVNNYYQAENRDRTWMAWLLALVTLAVTAIVIIGLFFGGRWVYRKLRNNTSEPTAVVTQKPAEPIKSGTEAPNPNPTPPAPESTNPTPAPGTVNAPTNPTPNPSSTQTNPPAATNPSPTQTNNTNLPNTGPGDMLSVFVLVSIIAYIYHRRVQKQ